MPMLAHNIRRNGDPYDQNAKLPIGSMLSTCSALPADLTWSLAIHRISSYRKTVAKLGNGSTRTPAITTFARTGDIYQLFCEQGCRLLKPAQGLLAYITSNSWLKAEYGKPLRRYFAERHTPLRLLEMGKDVFENTIVDTSVLLLREGNGNETCRAVDMDKLATKDFPPHESSWGQTRPDGEKPWSILSHAEQSIMDKMQTKGTPLKDWDIAINYGIKTGYNAAFVIDNDTKNALVAEDPCSVDLIKPVLRGRDIQRYRAQWAGLWLIATFPSLRLDIDNYPAVKKYLLAFGKDRLEQSGNVLAGGGKSRKKTQHSWFELQDSIAYHEDFAKEKLLWIELVENGRFAYDDSGIYGEATSFIMTGECTKYLCAVLNGKLIDRLVSPADSGLTEEEVAAV